MQNNSHGHQIDEQEVENILADIKGHKKGESLIAWGRVHVLLVGMPAIDLIIFISLMLLTESFVIGFFYPEAGINNMWQFIFVAFFLLFLSAMLVAIIISLGKKIFKNSSYFLQREIGSVTAQGKFINAMLKYETNSLLYVANMLEYDVAEDGEKNLLVLGAIHKKGGLLLKVIIFGFIFYAIWSTPGKWGWIEWSAFFVGATYVTIAFFTLITADELPEAKKYVFLLRQAILLKKGNFSLAGPA